jgi:hypothetical protein
MNKPLYVIATEPVKEAVSASTYSVIEAITFLHAWNRTKPENSFHLYTLDEDTSIFTPVSFYIEESDGAIEPFPVSMSSR